MGEELGFRFEVFGVWGLGFQIWGLGVGRQRNLLHVVAKTLAREECLEHHHLSTRESVCVRERASACVCVCDT